MLQAQYAFDGRKLDVVSHVPVRGLAHIEQLALEGKHSILVPPKHAKTAYGQGLGGITFCQDQRAFEALVRALICIV